MPGPIEERPLALADIPAILEILEQMETAEPADMYFDETELAEAMTGPNADLANGSLALLEDGEIVAAAFLDVNPPGDTWKATLSGGVREDRVGQGVGRRLVEAGKDMAHRLRDARDPDLIGELQFFVPEGRERAAELAARTGFETSRDYFDMRCELTGTIPEASPIVAGFIMTRWSADLDEATRQASNASFADHWGSRPMDQELWRHHVTGAEVFRPELSRLAVAADGSVAAFVIVEEFESETKARGYRCGYVSRVGTVRAHRGQGLATTLLVDALHGLAAAGFATAELGVDTASPTGATRLYRRIGFTEVRRNRLLCWSF